jgi:hypothetical protein
MRSGQRLWLAVTRLLLQPIVARTQEETVMAEESKPTVTMRIRVGDNELEVSGPSDFVERKIADFAQQQKELAQPAGANAVGDRATREGHAASGKKMALAQLLKKLGLKTEVDRVLAAGHYLEASEGVESFTAAEVSSAIRNAKNPPPRNANDAINQNIRKGLMMSAGDKDGKMAFVLTTDGEEKIASMLNE